MIKKKPKPFPDLKSEASLGFFHWSDTPSVDETTDEPFLFEETPQSNGLGRKIIIGVDEVGRGCLAGCVVAAAAVLDPQRVLEMGFLDSGKRGRGFVRAPKKNDHPIRRLQDSKLIPEESRYEFRNAVRDFVQDYEIAEASVQEIDTLNILYASHLAMERAVERLEARMGIRADWILIDGHIVPQAFRARGKAIVKGDQKSLSIACASILAKVYRDELMGDIDLVYPGYGLKLHKGYPTPFHKQQVRELGPTPIHRKSFKGVADLPDHSQPDFFASNAEV